MRLFLIIFFSISLNAQVINDNFINFNLPVLSNTLCLFLTDTTSNDSGSILKDLSGNGYDLSVLGFSNEAAVYPHLTGSNPQYRNGVALQMPGASDSILTVSSGTAANLNIRTNDFSIAIIFMAANISGNKCIAAKSASTGGGWALYQFNSLLRFQFKALSSSNIDMPDFVIAANKYYYLSINLDRDNLATGKLYNITDGTGPTTRTVDISSKSSEDLNASSILAIGRISWGGLWWNDGVFVSLRLINRLLTDREIIEDIYLAN